MKGGRRAALVFVLIGIGLLIAESSFGPTDHQVTFVLTNVEQAGTTTLLRHEHVTRLDCTVLDENGAPVGTMFYNHPGAIATPASLTLPRAIYVFRVKLTFDENGVLTTRNYERRVKLDGGEVRLVL